MHTVANLELIKAGLISSTLPSFFLLKNGGGLKEVSIDLGR